MFLKLLYAVLFITIQYAGFRKSLSTFYVSLYIYIYIIVAIMKQGLNLNSLVVVYLIQDLSCVQLEYREH